MCMAARAASSRQIDGGISLGASVGSALHFRRQCCELRSCCLQTSSKSEAGFVPAQTSSLFSHVTTTFHPVMRLPASHDMQPNELGRISYRAQFQLFRYPGSKSITNHSEPSLNPLETNLCTRALAKHRKPLWTCQASKYSSTAEQFLDVRPLQIVLTSSHQSCQFLSKPPQTNSP